MKDKNELSHNKDDYYHQAESWFDESYRKMRVSRNRAWIIGSVGLSVGLCGMLIVMMILPVKELVPYVVEVNRITGETYVKKPLQDSNVPIDEALTKYFLVKYINSRETYDAQDIEETYQQTAIMSTKKALKEYNALFHKKNPDNPLAKYSSNIKREVRVKAISFLNNNTASVRFESIEKTGDEQTSNHWVAIVSFKYVNKPTTEENRFINPLGFQITDYRVDQEVINIKG